MDAFEEDAAQHGAGLAALVSVLIDEGAEARHGGTQVLVQMEVSRYLDCHLVSLHIARMTFHTCPIVITAS